MPLATYTAAITSSTGCDQFQIANMIAPTPTSSSVESVGAMRCSKAKICRIGTERLMGAYAWQSFFKIGVPVAGGTDAHRVSSYNPFVSLQWYLDGTTIGGIKTRDDKEAPSRRQTLEMYTRNSAFMANDDDKRGTLEPGKFADLAVLSADYLTAPVNEKGALALFCCAIIASVLMSNMVNPAMNREPSGAIDSTEDAPDIVRFCKTTPEATS